MKNIEITTPQNVTIQYDLASVWERAFALALDVMIMLAASFFFWGILSWLFPGGADVLVYFTILPFVLLYSLIFELFNHGQSMGKMALKLRVIRMDGDRTGFWDYLMRWVFRALDIYFSLGGVAIISIISSAYNQRVGDLLANTVVVNVGKTERLRLENLLRLYQMNDYRVTYPQVTKMPESAMLIVKETLARDVELNNAAHNEALGLLADKMRKELEIKKDPKDTRHFLKTLLNDYIILTR